jgi:hypothetical protein
MPSTRNNMRFSMAYGNTLTTYNLVSGDCRYDFDYLVPVKPPLQFRLS